MKKNNKKEYIEQAKIEPDEKDIFKAQRLIKIPDAL